MIATLQGIISDKTESQELIVEVNGIGYGVRCAKGEFESLAVGREARLHIYEVIREDTHDLYGFLETSGKRLFEALIGVSGVGPKAALAILSLATNEQVSSAIARGDTGFIATASGVGKRTAERVAIELKDKVFASASITDGSDSGSDAALEALESLGYSRPVAVQALAQVDNAASDEERIKQALKHL